MSERLEELWVSWLYDQVFSALIKIGTSWVGLNRFEVFMMHHVNRFHLFVLLSWLRWGHSSRLSLVRQMAQQYCRLYY